MKENILGNAEVLEVFKISKTGNIAGCLINDGTIKKGEHARLIRDDIVVYEGKISELNNILSLTEEKQSLQDTEIENLYSQIFKLQNEKNYYTICCIVCLYRK